MTISLRMSKEDTELVKKYAAIKGVAFPIFCGRRSWNASRMSMTSNAIRKRWRNTNKIP